MSKLLFTLTDKMIAPRFDLATEVMILTVSDGEPSDSPRFILLPGPSADELCGLVIKENIDCLVCGGIEDEHYQFLAWKKVQVLDRVIGDYRDVLQTYLKGTLHEGSVIKSPSKSGGEKSA